MESDWDGCASGGSCDPDVVCEKQLFRSELSESLVQLACSHHHCAFPLNQNELCVWNTATPLLLSGHHYSISALSFGSKINPLHVCSASRERVIVWNLDKCTQKVQEGLRPRGVVIGTLLGAVLHVRFSPDDQQVAVCAGNQIYMLCKEAVLAELDGHLAPVTAAEFCTWEKSMLISVSEDRTFKVRKLYSCTLKEQGLSAFPLLSLLVDEENKLIITGCSEGQLWIFSLISDHNYRCVTHINLKKKQEKFYTEVLKSGKEIGNTLPEGSVETSLPILLIEHCDFLVCSALNTSYFWIGSSTGLLILNLANFELEAYLSYKGVKNTVKDQPLVFHNKIKSSEETTFMTFSLFFLLGHDGAINSVGWSHDKKWLVSASEDRTLRIWSVCSHEPALILGKEKFHKTVRFAQFYFIDAFILLCCGAEFHVLSFHPDTTKDDLKRYKQRSVCKLVQTFPMASTMEITSLSAVNEFYSYIVLTTGSNRALEVFDLNAGCSAAVIPEIHTRSAHQICQNKVYTLLNFICSTTKTPSTKKLEAKNIVDSNRVLICSKDGCERRFEGHSSRCYPCGIAVSPCGRFIASGSDDKYAYIYEMRSSTFSHKLGGHTESVINVTFSPSSPQVNLMLSIFLILKRQQWS
uniref:Uncharacterized protein n=1 Tax=Melopsittacus undulatus TaxID=13146 RepID=A0A8C6N757_MELUD